MDERYALTVSQPFPLVRRLFRNFIIFHAQNSKNTKMRTWNIRRKKGAKELNKVSKLTKCWSQRVRVQYAHNAQPYAVYGVENKRKLFEVDSGWNSCRASHHHHRIIVGIFSSLCVHLSSVYHLLVVRVRFVGRRWEWKNVSSGGRGRYRKSKTEYE